MKTLVKGLCASLALFALAGCATPVDRYAEKPYCHTDRGRNAYCTKENAPSLSKDEEAKQFPSDPGALTVYVVRYWGDGHHPLEILIDGTTSMETVPNSMIRLRLTPGSHRISFAVAGKSYDRTVNGLTGDVKLLGVTGTDWSWGSSSHAWADDSDDQVKRQARRSRLIKDVSLL